MWRGLAACCQQARLELRTAHRATQGHTGGNRVSRLAGRSGPCGRLHQPRPRSELASRCCCCRGGRLAGLGAATTSSSQRTGRRPQQVVGRA